MEERRKKELTLQMLIVLVLDLIILLEKQAQLSNSHQEKEMDQIITWKRQMKSFWRMSKQESENVVLVV